MIKFSKFIFNKKYKYMTSLDSSSPNGPFNVPCQHLLWVTFCRCLFYIISSQSLTVNHTKACLCSIP